VFFFDPVYFLFALPPMLLGMWAQARVKSTYAKATRQPANLSGAAAARHILDQSGLQSVQIEQIPGQLSDHYDPRAKVLRLSQDVYHGRTMAAVGIAAHEAGHAIQDAKNYAPLVIRNLAVPAANFGSGAGIWIFMAGMMLSWLSFAPLLIWGGIALFAATVVFQIINLPVEFDASHRAKALLVERGIVPQNEMVHVNRVLNAAALTYVAATLQAIMVLLYYIMRASSRR